MKRMFFAALCILVNVPSARAQEKEIQFIDPQGASSVPERKQWELPPQNALEVLGLETPPKKEEKKLKRSDKILVIAFGAVLAAGLAASVVSYRENARSGDGSICCRSEPYIPGQKRPVLIGDPNEDDH